MKLTINENIPMVAYRQAEREMTEWQEAIDDESNGALAAAVYGVESWASFIRYDKAELTAKRGGWETTHEIDLWLEAVVETDNCITKAGYYLSELWQSTGDNRDELRNLAWIRNYRLEK